MDVLSKFRNIGNVGAPVWLAYPVITWVSLGLGNTKPRNSIGQSALTFENVGEIRARVFRYSKNVNNLVHQSLTRVIKLTIQVCGDCIGRYTCTVSKREHENLLFSMKAFYYKL